MGTAPKLSLVWSQPVAGCETCERIMEWRRRFPITREPGLILMSLQNGASLHHDHPPRPVRRVVGSAEDTV